jgi:hypothetical protein
MSGSYLGSCFCGAVELRVTGNPIAMGYCHCQSCRSWSAAPVNAFTLWPSQAVEVTKGRDNIATHRKTEHTCRQFCRICGGHVMATLVHLKIVDVFAATIPGLVFVPQLHVFYSETVLPMHDGLPKLKDFPVEMGGSGEQIPE